MAGHVKCHLIYWVKSYCSCREFSDLKERNKCGKFAYYFVAEALPKRFVESEI